MGYPWEDEDMKRQAEERPSDICVRCDRPRSEHAHGFCYRRGEGGGASFVTEAPSTAPRGSESANDGLSMQTKAERERDAAIRELGEMSRRCGYAEEERERYRGLAAGLAQQVVDLLMLYKELRKKYGEALRSVEAAPLPESECIPVARQWIGRAQEAGLL